MKTKTFSILFALVMILSVSVGVFAQDFDETWDENTVLTVFNDLDLAFPDLFADIDSNFLWVESSSSKDFPGSFPKSGDSYTSKAPIAEPDAGFYEGTFTYDPCGDGLIKFEVTLDKMPKDVAEGVYYYGDGNTTYIRDITAYYFDGVSSTKLGLKKCETRGSSDCNTITYKKDGTAKLTGYLTVPYGMVVEDGWDIDMYVEFSDYMTALWPVDNTDEYEYGLLSDSGFVAVYGTTEANTGKKSNYCQESLASYDAFGYEGMARAKYDENTGEARLQAVIRNVQPDTSRQNYIIPAEVSAWYGDMDPKRITDYTCKYTLYNVANAAPRTDYCKFGEGIAIPDHGMVRIDISIDHLSGDLLRAADGDDILFGLRLGGMTYSIYGAFEAVDFPCPAVSRMVVKDPLHPFMSFFKLIGDKTIEPSGPYGVYEGGLWGMYQKCGKFAYVMVRLANDGVKDEIVDLNNTAVAINGGTPMNFNWVLSTVEPGKNNKILLEGGEQVILIGRAKVTDIPSQLNSDIAMTGAVNFTDFGFYITGKVFSDHNNTNCVAAPK